MNHGNLGILHYGTFSADTYLRLPLDTLRPLSIGMGTILTGVHYPPPAGHVGQNDHGVTPDFMLTPIPYELWPRVIRARVRMKHEPGTLHEVSQILADQGFSIHHGEATRSAHRYCSWNLVVSADIPDEDLSYEESKCIYKPTRKWMKRIEKNLSESVEAVFLDSHNERLTRGAMAWPLNSLAYFHYLCETGVISEPFKLHCQDHGRLTSRPHDGFSKLVQYLRGADKSEDACVFAERWTLLMSICESPSFRKQSEVGLFMLGWIIGKQLLREKNAARMGFWQKSPTSFPQQ